MTVLSIASAGDALKSFFLPSLRYQLNTGASAVLAQFTRDSQSVVGKDIIMALRYGRNGGFGGGDDVADLPVPNSRKTKQAKWETRNLYARIQISDKTMKAAKNDTGAFANLFKTELEDAQDDAKENLSRQIFGDSLGKLTTLTGVSGAVLTIPATDIQNFAEGMMVDYYNPTGPVKRNSAPVEVILVDEANSQITLSSATDAAISDFVTVQNSYSNEITGLGAVFTATTLYNLLRSSYPWFNAQRKNVAGEISETKIQEAIDDARRKAGSKADLLICSFGVRRAYQYLMQSQKRQVNTLDLKGGWTGLEYVGGEKAVGLVADQYCPAGKMYAIDSNDFKFYEIEDWTWLDNDGAVLSRVSGKPIWEASMVKYGDLGCQKPRGQVEMYGIVEH